MGIKQVARSGGNSVRRVQWRTTSLMGGSKSDLVQSLLILGGTLEIMALPPEPLGTSGFDRLRFLIKTAAWDMVL